MSATYFQTVQQKLSKLLTIGSSGGSMGVVTVLFFSLFENSHNKSFLGG